MTASYRYKFVKNSTGAPILNSASFPLQSDGDDKTGRLIKHIITAADVGNNPGQTRHASGLILEAIPSMYNVLLVEGMSYRPVANAGFNQYYQLDAGILLGIRYGLASDNTIRVIDLTNGGLLADGDMVIARITLGPKIDNRDVM